LNLSDNQIGDAGALLISNLSGIIKLNLAKNQIGEVGAQHIANIQRLTS
jgi:hypothetical protein